MANVALKAGTRKDAGDERGNFKANVEVARSQRTRMVGEDLAMDPMAGTTLGRCLLLKMISRSEYEAGIQIEALAQLMRMAKGWPIDRVQSIDIRGVSRGASGADSFAPDEIAAIERRYTRMVRALNGAGHGVAQVTVSVVMRDEPVTDRTLHALKTGLRAAADHFNGGGRSRRKPNRILRWSDSGFASLDPNTFKNP
jgi:hypothetical protein